MKGNCTHISLRVWLPLLVPLALLRPSSWAQDLPCSHQIVPLTVTAPDGRAVVGLDRSDFRGQFRERPVAILNASIYSGPQRIVLLLDVSGNFIDTEPWRPVLPFAKALVEHLPPEDSVALLVFAGQVERKIDFTRELKPILQELDDLQAHPIAFKGKSLWDTLLEALSLFDSPRIGDTIYAITDGMDGASHASRNDTETAMLGAGVRFFALLPPAPLRVRRLWDTTLESARTGRKFRGLTDLQEVADTTGGALLNAFRESVNSDAAPLSPTEVGPALDQLNGLTEHFYRLEIELAQPIDKVRDWQLDFADPTRNSKLRLGIHYPHKLVPCGASRDVH